MTAYFKKITRTDWLKAAACVAWICFAIFVMLYNNEYATLYIVNTKPLKDTVKVRSDSFENIGLRNGEKRHRFDSNKRFELMIKNSDSSDNLLSIEISNPFVRINTLNIFSTKNKLVASRTRDTTLRRNSRYAPFTIKGKDTLIAKFTIIRTGSFLNSYEVYIQDHKNYTERTIWETVYIALFFGANVFFLLILGIYNYHTAQKKHRKHLWYYFGYMLAMNVTVLFYLGVVNISQACHVLPAVADANYFSIYLICAGILHFLPVAFAFYCISKFVFYHYQVADNFKKSHVFFNAFFNILKILFGVLGVVCLYVLGVKLGFPALQNSIIDCFEHIIYPLFIHILIFAGIIQVGFILYVFGVSLYRSYQKQGLPLLIFIKSLFRTENITTLTLLVQIIVNIFILLDMTFDFMPAINEIFRYVGVRAAPTSFFVSPMFMIAIVVEIIFMFVAVLLNSVAHNRELFKRNKQLFESATQVSEQMYNRIASDIHDNSLGHLDQTIRYIETTEWGDKNDAAQVVATRLEARRKALRVTMQRIRNPAANMQPEDLQQNLLRWIAGIPTVGMRIYPEISNDFEGLSATGGLKIYRIVQEIINNATKHSQGSEIFITIQPLYKAISEDSLIKILSIMVEDNGIGFKFNLSDAQQLQSMRHNIGVLKGDFRIESTPQQGTSIIVRIPMQGVPLDFNLF